MCCFCFNETRLHSFVSLKQLNVKQNNADKIALKTTRVLACSFVLQKQHVSLPLTVDFTQSNSWPAHMADKNVGTVVWPCFIVHRCLARVGENITEKEFGIN